MNKKKILFVIGSPNQTSQMFQIHNFLKDEYDCYFSQFHPDYWYEQWALKQGLLETTAMGGTFKAKANRFLREHGLKEDYRGLKNEYDMTVFCTDMLVSRRLGKTKTVWVQEGMTDVLTNWAKIINLLRVSGYWAMNTSLNGSSNICDIYCAASEGYKEQFGSLGTKREKIVVTGIPNFDNIEQFTKNNLTIKDYVLVCTSDIRECFQEEDRPAFLQKCMQIAAGRPIIFKLHPNELPKRAIAEIQEVAGADANIQTTGSAEEMVANCAELITQYSTLAYVGLILGKKTHSYFDMNDLKKKIPLQNGGKSAERIAEICRGYMEFNGKGVAYLKTLQQFN